jgi:4-hydroxythreonine-4-phosphate dehydrogenase
MDENRPCAVTMGEPSGIGGELSLKAWQSERHSRRPFFVIDAPDRLSDISSKFGLGVDIATISEPSECASVFNDALPVIPLQNAVRAIPGTPDPRNADSVIESIKRAFEYTKNGDASAVVTNPLQKEALYQADFPTRDTRNTWRIWMTLARSP